MSLKPEERPEELAPAWCLLAEDTGVTAGFAAQGSGTEQDPELGESCLRPIPVRTESRRRDVGGGGAPNNHFISLPQPQAHHTALLRFPVTSPYMRWSASRQHMNFTSLFRLLLSLSRQIATGLITDPESMPLRTPHPGPCSHSGTRLTVPIRQPLLWLLSYPTDLDDLQPSWVRADNNRL